MIFRRSSASAVIDFSAYPKEKAMTGGSRLMRRLATKSVYDVVITKRNDIPPMTRIRIPFAAA